MTLFTSLWILGYFQILYLWKNICQHSIHVSVYIYIIFIFLSEISVCKFSFRRIFLVSFQSRPHLQCSNYNVCTSPFVMVSYFKNSYNSMSLCPSNCNGSMYKSAMKERSTTEGTSESERWLLLSCQRCSLLIASHLGWTIRLSQSELLSLQ